MSASLAEPHMLDTSAVIFLIRRKLVVTPSALIPFATMGELLIGVESSTDSTKELDKVQTVMAGAPIVYPTFDTLGPDAKITSYLRRLGQMIPVNDLWIAALALQWDVPLSTVDGHFERIPNLKVVRVR